MDELVQCQGQARGASTIMAIARLVGRRIREFRHARGWGQADLEAYLEGCIGRSGISYVENGRRHPSLKTLARCAQAFDVDPAVLLLDPRRDASHRVAAFILSGERRPCTDCPWSSSNGGGGQ